MTKWLESLYDYLLRCRGVNKCPLAYILIYQVAVKPHAIDPAIHNENVDQETRVNMERNAKKIEPYWLFLREYCSPLKSRNGRNDTDTPKRFDQAVRVATTRHPTRSPSKSSSDASERVKPSRHIALTAMLYSDQLLGMSKRHQNYRNLRFLVGAWDTPSSPSTPIGPIRSKPFYLRKF